MKMNKTVELTAVTMKNDDVAVELFRKVKNLEAVLNKAGEDVQGKAKVAVDKAFGEAKKAVKAYNKGLAKQYYLAHDLMDIVKAGKAVPAVELKTEEEDGVFTVKLDKVSVYPTCGGLDDCKVLPENTVDKIDLLRREVAYLKAGKNTLFLTGDVENKKEIPSAKVAEMIEAEGDISKNKVKVTLAIVLHEITGGEFKKAVFSKLYDDFEGFMVKRGEEWGTRNMVTRAVACDLVLEYAYLYFNDMREVKYTVG